MAEKTRAKQREALRQKMKQGVKPVTEKKAPSKASTENKLSKEVLEKLTFVRIKSNETRTETVAMMEEIKRLEEQSDVLTRALVEYSKFINDVYLDNKNKSWVGAVDLLDFCKKNISVLRNMKITEKQMRADRIDKIMNLNLK